METTIESKAPAELPRYYQLEVPRKASSAVADLVAYLCGPDRHMRFPIMREGCDICAMRLWMTPTEADILSTVLAEDLVGDWFLAPTALE